MICHYTVSVVLNTTQKYSGEFQKRLESATVNHFLIKEGWRSFKGVLHPRPVFGLFLHFSQKLQHIGNK